MKLYAPVLLLILQGIPFCLVGQISNQPPLPVAETFSRYIENTYRGTDSVAFFYESDGTIISQINFNQQDGQWHPTLRQIYQYDANRNLTLLQSEAFTAEQWIPRYRSLYGAYQIQQPGFEERQTWSSEGGWTPTIRFDTRYNEQGEITYQLRSEPDLQGMLQPTFQTTISYDQAFRILEWVMEIWEVNNWQPFQQSTYTYDEQGRRREILERSMELLAARTTYRYPTFDSVITLHERFDQGSQTWNPWIQNITRQHASALPLVVKQYIYTDTCSCFTPTNVQTYRWEDMLLVENDFQVFSDGQLHNQRRIVYAYNDQACLIGQSFFAGSGTDWIPVNRRTIEVDMYCQSLVEITDQWDGQSFQPATRRQFYYVEGGNAPFSSFPDITIAPNPTEAFLHIYLTEDQLINKTSYTLLDLSGRIMLEGTCVAPTTRLTVSHFTPGVYLLRLFSPLGIQLSKVIVK